MHRIARCILVAAPLLSHCTGDVQAPASPGPGAVSSPIGALCQAGTPAPTPIRRLTKAQYRSALSDVLSSSLPQPHFDAVWREVAPAIQGLAEDVVDKHAPFATMDRSLSLQHVERYLQIGEIAGRAVAADEDRLAAFMGCRPEDPPPQCIDGFIDRFGARALRHPLSTGEREFLRSVYATDRIEPAAVADVIAVALNSPQFLYQLEFGAEPLPDRPSVVPLSDHELANRLALHFWQAPPDEELRRAADAGELRTEVGYERALEHVLADPRSTVGLRTFVSEWLDLDNGVPPLHVPVGDPLFDAFAGEDVPTPELRLDMIADVIESFRFHFQRDDTYEAWLLSPYSFAKSDDLARIYGTPKWHGTGMPPQFPPGARSGLITRAALLASGSANTRPIKRGVLIRERLLCDVLPPPDPTAMNTVAQTLSGQHTTREAVTSLTETPGTTCVMCHKTKINGLGFLTEGYDGLGRKRTHQKLYDEQGRVLAERPVVTAAEPHIDERDRGVASDASELARRLADSSTTKECFARQFVRFAFGRKEREVGDCLASEAQVMLSRGQGMRSAVKALALRAEFRTKVIEVPR